MYNSWSFRDKMWYFVFIAPPFGLKLTPFVHTKAEDNQCANSLFSWWWSNNVRNFWNSFEKKSKAVTVSRTLQLTFSCSESNNINNRKRCKICSKLTVITSEQRLWRRSVVFIVNFEHISNLFLFFILLDFEQVHVS